MREPARPAPGTSPGAAESTPTPGPQQPAMPVRTTTVVKLGTVLWAVALLVTLAVPALREGERDWWPWACVAGLALGVIGYVYVRRGRGNAEGVE